MNTNADSRPNLECLLSLLHSPSQGHVVIIGIGNRFWGDDGAGPELTTKLKAAWRSPKLWSHFYGQRFFVDAGDSPEDWLIRILDLKPELIVVVDAIDLQAEPGTIAVLEAEALPGCSCFSTHRLPLKSLLKLWEQNGSKALVLAIQPENVEFGQGISAPVEKNINLLVDLLSVEHRDST